MMDHAGRNLAPWVSEQNVQFKFVLETGPGVHYFVKNRITWIMGMGLHHISNANLGDRTTEITTVLLYVGI